MPHPKDLQLTLDGDSATLCVEGVFDDAGDTSILDLCAALPLHVRTLRLDLRPLGAMSEGATNAVRTLLAHWRTTRGGDFRLITSHLLATCTPVPAVKTPKTLLPAASTPSDFLTAAYL